MFISNSEIENKINFVGKMKRVFPCDAWFGTMYRIAHWICFDGGTPAPSAFHFHRIDTWMCFQAFDISFDCLIHSHTAAAMCYAKFANTEKLKQIIERETVKSSEKSSKIREIGKHKSVIRQLWLRRMWTIPCLIWWCEILSRKLCAFQ